MSRRKQPLALSLSPTPESQQLIADPTSTKETHTLRTDWARWNSGVWASMQRFKHTSARYCSLMLRCLRERVRGEELAPLVGAALAGALSRYLFDR